VGLSVKREKGLKMAVRNVTDLECASLVNVLRLGAQQYLQAANAAEGALRVQQYEMAQVALNFADQFEQASEAIITFTSR
jgi:hypothetical protein